MLAAWLIALSALTGVSEPADTLPADSAVCTPAPARLCPVDEAPDDPDFQAFRASLIEAVNARDEQRLLNLLDPRIRTNFGDGGTIENFRKLWKTSSPESPLWLELKAILEQGGVFREPHGQKRFTAPYVAAAWTGDFNVFQHVAAVRPNVPLRSEPTPDAAPVTTVHWEILRILPDADKAAPSDWLRVETLGGQEGWVQKTDVRSPGGLRAGFSNRTGPWRMDALVSGD